jgi:hypothetical protein
MIYIRLVITTNRSIQYETYGIEVLKSVDCEEKAV